MFIEADSNMRKIILKAFNDINQKMTIPITWQKEELCRIFKGKGREGEKGQVLLTSAVDAEQMKNFLE